MSYEVTVKIVCNEVGCGRTLVITRDNAGGLNKTEAAVRAQERGWYTKGRYGTADPSEAYCAEHAAPHFARQKCREFFSHPDAPKGSNPWIRCALPWRHPGRHDGPVPAPRKSFTLTDDGGLEVHRG